MNFTLLKVTFLTALVIAGPALAAPTLDEDVLEDLDSESSESTLSEDDYKLPDENFTGTLDDEDDDNPEYERIKDENEAFGDDDEMGEDAYPEDDQPNYLIKFNFDAQVVFMDQNDFPYLEINYNTKFEEEFTALMSKRSTTTGEVEFESDIVGDLAGNDLFTCKLDIMIESHPVDIMARVKRIAETEDEPESFEMALQIKLEKDYKEDWYSNCTGVDGSVFNTQGDPEKYNLQVLDGVAPSLNAILVEEFYPDEETVIELVSEPLIVDDEDMNETVTLTGSGTITIEPL